MCAWNILFHACNEIMHAYDEIFHDIVITCLKWQISWQQSQNLIIILQYIIWGNELIIEDLNWVVEGIQTGNQSFKDDVGLNLIFHLYLDYYSMLKWLIPCLK